MNNKFVVCYLVGRMKDGVETPVSLKEVLQEKRNGGYKHTDYFCSLFDTEEQAWSAYREYEFSYGKEYSLLEEACYGFVSSLGEQDL